MAESEIKEKNYETWILYERNVYTIAHRSKEKQIK